MITLGKKVPLFGSGGNYTNIHLHIYSFDCQINAQVKILEYLH